MDTLSPILVTSFTNPDNLNNDLSILKSLDNKQSLTDDVIRQKNVYFAYFFFEFGEHIQINCKS